MSFWTYQNLADVTNGTWLVEPADLSAQLTGLWHDTREIKEGQAYLAIAGDNFDGHDFLDQAFAAGAALAIVSAAPSLKPQASSPTLRVADTVVALQDLARAYRDELSQGGCKVIGIAGSNGKTTTRHLIHHVLTHAGLKGTQSPKSFNNHLGVPLTLLSAKPDDDFVAAEIGTNHPGEIAFLSEIARPDIAVITSIGEEHMEFFNNLDAVAEEEMSICDYLPEGGVVVAGLGELDQKLRIRLDGKHEHYATYDEECDPPHGFRLLGEHNEDNARTTSMVASLFGIGEDACCHALLGVEPAPHRGNLIRLGNGVSLYDDCYNANPSSVIEALKVLHSLAFKQAVFILGDMFELGEQGPAAHRKIGELVRKMDIERFITIGRLSGHSYDAAGNREADKHFPDFIDSTPDQVADILQPGDTVLIKASRGMRLERLIPAIEQRFGPATGDEPT
jgi:UDP-N-acetylmuramoyl-tripeptide--D-alanyl-D-alanine ligase